MNTSTVGLDNLLASLKAKREQKVASVAKKAESDMGSTGTSHATAKADNSTTAATEGARSAENKADNKAQQPLSTETAGSPATGAPAAGSQGVDAKDATQAPAAKPDTSGVSEMANKDTALPKAASVTLAERIKAARAGCGGKAGDKPGDGVPAVTDAGTSPAGTPAIAKGAEKSDVTGAKPDKKTDNEPAKDEKKAEDKTAAEKEAAEKFAAYCEDLVKNYPEDFSAGCKFAMDVLAAVTDAAGAMPPAGAEGLPPEAGAAPGAEGAPDEAQLDQLAAELEAAGVTPEALAAALEAQGTEGGEAGGMPGAEGGAPGAEGGEQDVAALQEAMQAEGMSPEELAAAVQAQQGAPAEGGAPPAAEVAGDAAAKAAAVKEAADKHAAHVNQLRTEIRAIKAAAQAKK